ncbi:hypothetical protein ACJX0J_035324, partial [Zea mays]
MKPTSILLHNLWSKNRYDMNHFTLHYYNVDMNMDIRFDRVFVFLLYIANLKLMQFNNIKAMRKNDHKTQVILSNQLHMEAMMEMLMLMEMMEEEGRRQNPKRKRYALDHHASSNNG